MEEGPALVIKRKVNGVPKPYELVYGFGRTMALLELKQKEWYFTENEADEDSIDDDLTLDLNTKF